MTTENFSQAMSEIDTKYLEEAISYKPKKKIIPLYKRITAAAAALFVLIGLSFYVGSVRHSGPSVYYGGNIVSKRGVSLSENSRGIALASEESDIHATLTIKSDSLCSVLVSDGFVSEVIDGAYAEKHESISVAGGSLIIWEIENADIGSHYNMTIVSQEKTEELTLKFNSQKNSWVISRF